MDEKRLTVRCRECGTKYRLRDYEPGMDLPDCPRCGRIEENKLDFSKPINIVQGGSPTTQAIQIAEKIATEQYGLSDFKTGKLADGEPMAKSQTLTPTQQMMDNAWKNAGRTMAPAMQTGGSLLGGMRADAADRAATQTGFQTIKRSKLKLIDMATGRATYK